MDGAEMDGKARSQTGPEDPEGAQTSVSDQLIQDEIDGDPDTKCGLGNFHPDALQVFSRIGAFVGVYSASGLLTSSLAVYVNSQVSMLEKQFGFSSAETGFIMSCNDIGYLGLVIFAGYLAKKVHIPRGLGISTMLYGICGILCALPYFLVDQSDYDIDVTSLKTGNTSRVFAKSVPMCDNATRGFSDPACTDAFSKEALFSLDQIKIKKTAFILICVGMVFQGIGKSTRYPFVTLYIDDAVDKRKTGFYMGIVIGTGIFGPALAYLLGGLFSKIYVTLQAVPITPRDPRWIGAWWLGFIIFGACALVTGIPIMCFPKKLPSSVKKAMLNGTKKEMSKKAKTSLQKRAMVETKDFLTSMLRLAKNPVYVCLIVSNCINIFGVGGILSFLPKYLSSQYSIPLWQANIIMAICNISAVSLGSFLGGILTRKIKMRPRTMLVMMCTFMAINIVCQVSGFFLGCNQPDLYGNNGQVDVTSSLYQPMRDQCEKGCECNDEKYFPICGGDGRSYYSPCHGGCTSKAGMNFFNCTCIPSGRAVGGICGQGCSHKLYIYAALAFVGGLFKALKIIPTFIAQVRSVDERDRAVGAAVSGFLSSTLGWMPSPVVSGLLIDNTCSLWQFKCGERLSCQLYDIVSFRNVIHSFGTICTGLAILPLIVAAYLVRKRKEWHKSDIMNMAKPNAGVSVDVKDKVIVTT